MEDRLDLSSIWKDHEARTSLRPPLGFSTDRKTRHWVTIAGTAADLERAQTGFYRAAESAREGRTQR